MLDFGSLADGQPLRLVLVAREMGVPTSAESGSAYWPDHLFVDADGVPTRVEVKRASDTRIRREVVGQMLDYAANGARYWPAALLQRSFEETCVADGRSLDGAYRKGHRTEPDGPDPQRMSCVCDCQRATVHRRILLSAPALARSLPSVVKATE
ncbi:hypothetical protein ACFVYD_16285 [Streptomyces sp. NPDC058301]|uniref:hypothetical protein n=1 Tax=Streptomyces sp. NPDC058301 TaxID=3346436 RepID=UPI0036E51A79